MPSEGYLLDTNIVSAYIKNIGEIRKCLNDIARKEKELFISIVTHYEIRRGLLAVNATRKMKIFEEICKQFRILWFDSLEISENASEIYASLRKRGELISDNDIMIAATALTYNLTVITDDGHFGRIQGISVENWLRK